MKRLVIWIAVLLVCGFILMAAIPVLTMLAGGGGFDPN